ncbi:hypothetical protein BC831DRAFT_130297 [Entophlyctis helioformis]|nr:hypothetical protein BC831DRAFT_130297 [Entophlyctis helioformis]
MQSSYGTPMGCDTGEVKSWLSTSCGVESAPLNGDCRSCAAEIADAMDAMDVKDASDASDAVDARRSLTPMPRPTGCGAAAPPSKAAMEALMDCCCCWSAASRGAAPKAASGESHCMGGCCGVCWLSCCAYCSTPCASDCCCCCWNGCCCCWNGCCCWALPLNSPPADAEAGPLAGLGEKSSMSSRDSADVCRAARRAAGGGAVASGCEFDIAGAGRSLATIGKWRNGCLTLPSRQNLDRFKYL